MAEGATKPVTLYVPERRKGRGSGHLRRSLELLRSNGGTDLLFLPEEGDNDRHPRLHALVHAGARMEELAPERFVGSYEEAGELIRRGRVARVVFDLQELDLAELRRFRDAPLLVGLDTGGAAARYLDFTIETLPRLPGESDANIEEPGYLALPTARRSRWPEEIERVLVTLGGEDAGSRAGTLASALRELFPELTFFHTEGGAIRGEAAPFVDSYTPLREHLHNFDLILTHYGMTLFEALWTRVPVLALPVTRYHEELTKALDLDLSDSLEVEAVAPELGRIVTDPGDTVERCRRVAPTENRNLYERLHALTPPTHRNPLQVAPTAPTPEGAAELTVPAGENPLDPVVRRYPDRSYYRCGETGLLYARLFRPTTITYSERYFFEEYRKQYGRTYLEDFEQIKKMGDRRLRRIRKAVGTEHSGRSPALLDIGCAYGPFLSAAEEAGFEPHGIDVAADAVEYVSEDLGYPAARGSLGEVDLKAAFGIERFDVITMWYVIEHLPDLGATLALVREHLRPGGVFAFGTPNGEGISGTTNSEAFLRDSPEDHVTLWEPSKCGGILRRFGFDAVGFRVTGHHPERFPLIREGSGGAIAAILRPLLFLRSKASGLGDTFECFARCR